jgi:hypothetical protein
VIAARGSDRVSLPSGLLLCHALLELADAAC